MAEIRSVRTALDALTAGLLGGAVVGFAEAALVSATSGAAEEYWMFLFGVVAYGALGAGLGSVAGVAWQGLRRGRASGRAVAQVAVAMGVAVPALAVTRYHVAQRIFREELILASVSGVVTHVLLLAGAAAVAVAAVAVWRGCYGVAGRVGPVLAVGLLGGTALLIGFFAGAPVTKIVRRSPSPAAAGGPNVIVIVADTLRGDAIAKSAQQLSPGSGFAQLAGDGVTFEGAYSQSSWTRPSIATILASQYPSVHGAVHKMDFLQDRVVTLAESLQAEGYWTAAFTTNINVAPVFNFQQGFDEFHYIEPSFYFWATDSATKLAIYKGLRVARERLLSNRIYFEHFYQDAAVVDEHLKTWLAERPPEPFFLFVHYMDPHDPYFEIPYNGRGVARVLTPSPAPERVAELRDLYQQGVRYLDGYLHELFDRLKTLGLYDRSIIAFTADHGEEFYEHGGWWHGTTLYEEQVHVPLIIKRATESQAGQRRKDMVRTLDIAPTVTGAAGLAIPETFMGVDLFRNRVSGPLLADEDLEGNRLSAIRDGDWKLITANPGNPRGLAPVELYNLAEDPGEQRNLATRESGRVNDMLSELSNWRARIAAHGRRAVGTARTDVVDPRT